MRAASKVFRGIGIFATIAAILFAAASRFAFDNLQGAVVLGLFAFANHYLANALGRDADVDELRLPVEEAHEDEEIHLPGPSWFPAFYGVTLPVLFFGLVFHALPVIVAGVVLTVLVTIGWARESVKDYRREIAHHKPGPVLPDEATMELARQVLAFRRDHGGADSVVQHIGRGAGEIVLVGRDGAWGNLVVRDVEQAREACALADTDLHPAWPSGLGSRVRTGPDQWIEMGGERTFEAAGHDAPRDGTTQVAARVFLGLSMFAAFAALLYSAASRFSFDNLQGTAILTAFAGACYYLYLGLKNAKARPEDAAYVGEEYVTLEPEVPDPPIDLETLHLPGPSWWPAAFSIALGVLVWGLVFHSVIATIGGILLLVVCCVGWGIESVHEYRQQISGQHHGAADALHNDPAPLAH
ncbi:MAG TPA: cytochrome c oxidase subunit 4 [Frankiaceae bacterium]|nr:cytochrome c oxidase subunit 4 [Frankiaceae bacterium]